MSKMLHIKSEGNLNWEKLLLAADVPVFFICRNGQGERYACFLADCMPKSSRYIVVKVTNRDILELLENKITIRDFFTKKAINNAYWDLTCDDFTFECSEASVGCASEIPNEFLPEKGEFLDNDGMLDDYIQTIGREITQSLRVVYSPVERMISGEFFDFPQNVFSSRRADRWETNYTRGLLSEEIIKEYEEITKDKILYSRAA